MSNVRHRSSNVQQINSFKNYTGIIWVMDSFPVIFIIFKIAVLGTGMFFAVKWHYDQDRKARKGDILTAVGKISAILALLLIGLLFATFKLASLLGLDMQLSQ